MLDSSIDKKISNPLTFKTTILSTLMVTGFAAMPVQAATVMGFQGLYDPSNFTLDNFNADGFVDTSNAPNSILLRGGDNGSGFPGETSYTTVAAAAGTVMFDFNYDSFNIDGPAFDPFGVILNGIFTQLTDNDGLDAQNGMFSFNVAQGDIFGFAIQTVDNLFGSSEAVISNFKAPAPGVTTPEPASLFSMIAMGGLGLILKRRQQM
jgi:hypothetical protein